MLYDIIANHCSSLVKREGFYTTFEGMQIDDASNAARVGAHHLQWPTRPNAAQVKVEIQGVFVSVVTESKTLHIYKAVHRTINSVPKLHRGYRN
jgi:hypothetical protein